MTIPIAVCLRQDTAANIATLNPILRPGEEWRESDTGLRKVGDGVTPWNALSYDSTGGGPATAGVNSYNGRDGDVVPATGDYTATMVGAEPAGAVATHAASLSAHPTATSSSPGFIASADKAKLDGIDAGAQVNPPQISNTEITTPTGTAIRSVSPADLNAFVAAHAASGGATGTLEIPYVILGSSASYVVPTSGADYEWTGGIVRMRVNFQSATRIRSSIVVVTAGSAGTEAFLQYSRATTPTSTDWTTIPNSTFSIAATGFFETTFTAVLSDMKVDAEVWVRVAAHNGNGVAAPAVRLFTLYVEQSAYVAASGVASVNGRTGAVTLTNTDVSLGNVTNDAQIKAALGYTTKTTPVAGDYFLIKDSVGGAPKLVDYSSLPSASSGGATTYAEVATGTTGTINAPDADIVLCFNTAAIGINLPIAPRNSQVFWCYGGLITFYGGPVGSGQTLNGGSFTSSAGTSTVPSVYPFVRRLSPNQLTWVRGN